MLINNKKNSGYLTAITELNVLQERFATDFKLWQLTKFNKINSHSFQKCLKLVCHLSFKKIKFDKKKIIISLFLLEVLSSQKSFLIQSSSNNILLKIRKGSPVGCKVTLRNKKMYEMFDSLALAFTNISTRSFIKVSKKMTVQGGRFFCYQIDSLERFFYLSSLVLGEEQRQIDFCWIFNNHVWQESVFYLSSFKLPLNINFKQSWELKKNFNIKKNKTSIKKVTFIEDQVLFYLNKIFFILKESKINLLVSKSTHLRLSEHKKLLGDHKKNVVNEIKLPKKYLNLLTFIKNYPLTKNVISGDIVLLVINSNITAHELSKLLFQCLKSNEIMPIGLFISNQFFTVKWLQSKLDYFKNNNVDSNLIILFLLEMASKNNLLSILNLNKFNQLNNIKK